MAKNKTLYIHIGTGKTGTSAIQMFLNSNDQQLENKHELLYLKTGRENSKHRSLDFNARRKQTNYESIVIELLNAAKTEILSSSSRNFLVSDEDFPGLTSSEINILQELFSPEIELKLVVYLRRQDEYLESWFAQIVKTGAYTTDIIKLYDRLASTNLLSYTKMLTPWQLTLGQDNIVVRPYENCQFRNLSLFDDFIDIFKIRDQSLTIPPKAVNTSLTRDKILLLRKLSRNGLESVIDQTFISHLKTIETNGDSKYMLSNEKRTEIALRYENSNNQIAQQYLNQEKLFCSPLPVDSQIPWRPRSEVPDKLFIEMFKYHNASCIEKLS